MWTTIICADISHASLKVFLINTAIHYLHYYTTYRVTWSFGSTCELSFHRPAARPSINSYFLIFRHTFKQSVAIQFQWSIFQTAFDALVWHDSSELIRHRPNSFNYKPYKQTLCDKIFSSTESTACGVSLLSINALATERSSRKSCEASESSERYSSSALTQPYNSAIISTNIINSHGCTTGFYFFSVVNPCLSCSPLFLHLFSPWWQVCTPRSPHCLRTPLICVVQNVLTKLELMRVKTDWMIWLLCGRMFLDWNRYYRWLRSSSQHNLQNMFQVSTRG